MDDDGQPGVDLNPMEPDPGKMFIGGLHSQTTADSLQRYFEQFGEVKECVVMRDTVTKRSRGFGFVRFVDASTVELVQNASPHNVDGKKIDPKRAIPKRPPPGQNQFKKVFVGGLPPDINAQELTEYFEAFGKVTEVLLMHDKNTKRLRGFGFITFESDASGKHVCETGFHKLKGKNVECKRAQPKEAMMLQGKGRGFVVNLAPFPFGRGYPNGLGTSPVGYGFTDWTVNPQLYQQIANVMQYGRGRGGFANNYASQGFLNMPDHRRSYTEYGSVQTAANAILTQEPTSVTASNVVSADNIHAEYDQHNVYSNVQLTQYGSQQNPVVTPASPLTQAFTQTTSPRLDVSYMNASSRTGIAPEHLFHNGHTAASPQGPFGHGMSQIALRH